MGVGAMAAILGMDLERVTAVCTDAAQGEVCEPANINSAEQIVISGHTAAVERATKLAGERGAKRAIMLSVSAPFHCSLMKPAQDRLAVDLQSLGFRNPGVPVVCNVDAALIEDGDGARDALVRQVTGAVKWEPSMRLLIGKGVQAFVEVGPGKVVCGLMRQIDRSKTCANVGDEASLLKTLEQLTAEKSLDRSAKQKFARRRAQGIVGFFHPQLSMLGAVIDDHVNHHTAGATGASAGAVHFVILDNPPLSARAPILNELVQGIPGIFFGMLPSIAGRRSKSRRRFRSLYSSSAAKNLFTTCSSDQ